MEIRDWALRILTAETLEDKLFDPILVTDFEPGPALRWSEPSRPVGCHFSPKSTDKKLPPFHDHQKAENRAICLHRFAGHELLAMEIMAFVLLAFPKAHPHFRKGVIHTLREEQEHFRLYLRRMKELGMNYGDCPSFRHFWAHTKYIQSPRDYIAMMSLTLEQANLDFALMYGASFARVGDQETAKLMRYVLEDEIEHVAFGYQWLQKMKLRSENSWDTWVQSLSPIQPPARAKGFILHPEPRLEAGLPQSWIDNLLLEKG